MSSSSSLTPSSGDRDGADAGVLEGDEPAGRALDGPPLDGPPLDGSPLYGRVLDAVDRARWLRAAGR
jgi:hypothetical protein